MARPEGHRFIYCYLCGHRFEVGRRTMSTSCPKCHRPVLVEDIVVKGYRAVMRLETCGKVVTKKGGIVAQQHVVAHAGIVVEGRLNAKETRCPGHVTIASTAEWRGDLHAVSLELQEGAVIIDGHFRVPSDPLGPHRHQEKESPDG